MLETMKLVCELLSAECDGSIPLELFYEIYEYLSKIDGTIKSTTIKAVHDYLDQFAYVNRDRCNIALSATVPVPSSLGRHRKRCIVSVKEDLHQTGSDMIKSKMF